MKKILTITIILAQFILFSTKNAFSQSQAVKHYVLEEEILEHNQLPLNPYPPFGLLTGYITYPFQFYGSKNFSIDKRRIKILVAENEYLKIGMAPDYGGRLWFVYDKILKKEIIHRDYKEAKFYNAGMGYQYLGGGLELNIPNAHSPTNARKRDCVIRENSDGSVSLIMSNTEKIGRLHWSVSFTLSPGEARIKQDVRLANESPIEERYLYWANCGIPVNGNTEFIYPENRGALHGKYENAVSWPVYAGRKISILKNVDEAVGFYMLGAREGYMGYYNHDEDFGLVHYADVNDLPGKKYWSWGWHITGQNNKYSHAEDVDYGEIQSGRIVIQEKFNKILPGTSTEYRHYWYPIGAIGSFNGASENAALNFRLHRKSAYNAMAVIKIQANIKYDKPRILIRDNYKIIKEIEINSLLPERIFSDSVMIKVAEKEMDNISVELRDNKNDIIAVVLSPSQTPQKYDSYLIPPKHKNKTREDFTAEGLFAEAEILLNDWFYHLPEIKKKLAEVLTVDPEFSRAHTELGLLDLRGGKFEAALEHFNTALKRTPDDGRSLYYKGIALAYMGNYDEAVYWLRMSGRFGFEYAERIAEAEIALNINDLKKAQTHLARALKLNSTMVNSFLLKALLEKKLGNDKVAINLLDTAKTIDAENPFTQCTEYILKNIPRDLGNQITERYADLPDELLEVVAILYGNGLYKEALNVIGLIRQTNPIIHLYRTELSYLCAVKEEKMTKKTKVNDFTWRLEEFKILERRLGAEPQNGELFYLLGDFYYAHDFEQEGIDNWEKAVRYGYKKNKVLLISLYRAYTKLAQNEKAYKYLLSAYALDKNDPYIFEYYVDEISKRKGIDAAIKLMENNYTRFDKSYSLKVKLMNAYLHNGKYDKLEKLLVNSKLHDTHRINFGNYWKSMKMAEGYIKLQQKAFKEALNDFESAAHVPQNVAQHFMASFSDQARRLFYIGYCNLKLANGKNAKSAWLEALKLKRDSRFQEGYNYDDILTIYYQAFCLKGLGRYDEARVYIKVLQEFAKSCTIADNKSLQKQLLIRSLLGLEDMDNFDKWDTPLGTVSTKIEFNAPEE
jgi:tetratricopeptide (TPR) repeat protein